ncbi:hypothetical protein L596_016495 [Steinernema carpocapsae]|nr:hypothetical protein L596_016495 [Steinernema carpocapsae]
MRTYWVMMGICYTIAFYIFVVYLTPNAGMTYTFETLAWSYVNHKSALMEATIDVEKIVASTSIAIELVCYLCIFGLIVKKRLLTSKPLRTSHPEFRILLTSIVVFCYQCVMIIPFQYGSEFLPDSPWTTVLNSAVFAFFPTFQQLGLLLLNTELRKRFLKVFTFSTINGVIFHTGTGARSLQVTHMSF